ncbi:MAG TPA: cytosine permease [Actinophytocola sp.]|uniref:cytosine permease n=1 Tax=Actinophytocola sp. TaxID=1872138 RepID=UPI002DB5DE77|nr:cytosine permease [Actinophytocola sp.]HEU5473459.1 cytosine permease [Actinophytocola sp.]
MELADAVRHDYSTSRAGIVPLSERRSRYHFLALWTTLAAGFTFLFLGFQYHDAGYSLAKAVAAGALGGLAYLGYALPAAYLGSVTGQTHALLTRSIFGRLGSALVSLLLIGVAAGWAAFAFNLLATLYDGLFGWGNIALIAVLFAVLGIVNNLFGFTGIAAFARYVVAPVMIIWVLYLVVKGLTGIPAEVLGASPPGTTELPFLAGIGVAIGSVMWGNEPDTWRYGKPRFDWPLLPLLVAVAVGLVLFVAGGWMMAELSGAGPFDFGPAYRYVVGYSLFGALWLGALVATALVVAINDGNYYEMTTAGQNVVGHAPGWRRWHTCLIMAGVVALVAWWFPRLEHGFFTVAGWSSIALPCATVVMCVDQFVLPRLLGITRPVTPVPSWREAAPANWPAIVAVLGAVLFGAWGLGLLPGQEVVPSIGLVAVEAWLLAGLLYAGLAALTARVPAALGIRRDHRADPVASADREGELTR